MSLTDYGILSNEVSSKENNLEILVDKITDFQVIILYDRQPNRFDYQYLIEFPTKKLKEKVNHNHVFPRVNSETFIVWQHAYEENVELFYKLRMRARNEMLLRITEFMVAKFFSEYENYLVPILKNKTKLKWDLLNKLFHKYESMLHQNTRILDEKAWEKFNDWFKKYLSHYVIDEMIQVFEYEHLRTINQKELNQLFFQKMNKNFSENDRFMNEFTRLVNSYIEKWISEVIITSDVEKGSIAYIADLLGMSGQTEKQQQFESLVKNRNLLVMSNVIYQSIIETLSNQVFKRYDEYQWPKAKIVNNLLKGTVQLKLDEESRLTSTWLSQIWQQVEILSELDVDIFDALCHIYLAKSTMIQDGIEIQFDDLLNLRGLKPKLGGSGRRGGYETKQRQQVLKALSILQDLWIEMEDVVVYEKGKRMKKSMKGRALHFKDLKGNEYRFNDAEIPERFVFTMGKVFEPFLSGSGRQVKLLPKQAIEYNPYQRKWEKKLIRYLSWRWRTQARKGSYLQPHKISTLLEKIDVQRQSQTPSRIRERLEKALDVLLEEGVITFWQYDQWDEDNMLKRGWFRIWQDATIIIAPPDDIRKYYQPLERKKSSGNQKKPPLLAQTDKIDADIGEEFRRKRLKLGLTLQNVSHELDISTSYLSNIERGGSTPSTSLYRRMNAWME